MSTTDFTQFDLDFLIPNVTETPPTLEEILNQKDDFQIENILDECDLELNFLNDLQINTNKDSSCNIIELNYIKSQLLLSKNEQVNSGNPSSLVVSKNYIVIGTFYGHILVFDLDEKLNFFFKNENEFGSITALSINRDQTKLICGGGKGAIALWNLINGELIRVVEDLHAPFSSIINLKYLSDSNFIILSDTSGSVFVLDGRKKELDSQCIFSGSRGEVLSLQPLIIDEIENCPEYRGLEELCFVAMATVSKVIVISVKPSIYVHFTSMLKTSPDFLPILCWNVTIHHKNRNAPLFTYGRQDQLFMYKMVTDYVEKIEFLPLYHFKTSNYCIQNLCWISPNTLFIMDTFENVHLVDVLDQDKVESIDLSHIELVYENSQYKSLVNGGYVSRAMVRAGEHACGNSFSLRKETERNKLYILGLKSVYEFSIRTWQERVDYLINEGEIFTAISLVHDKYCVFKENSTEECEEISQILDIMEYAYQKFEDFIFQKNFLMLKNPAEHRNIISICLKYCVCLREKHQKVFSLYEKISSNEIAKGVFIESLEQYIFNKELNSVNPVLVKEIIEYYINKNWFSLLDSILIHFDIISLDIDYIIKIFSDYYLYDSYIYIYNCAFHDFLSPFDTLLRILDRSIKDKQTYTEQDILLGNKLLVYLNCMLTCVYYPNKGYIDDEDQSQHLEKVYSRIGSKNSEPNVANILLKYDCTEFLNVMLIAFEYLNKHPNLLKWKQEMIDLFIKIICDSQNIQFSSDQKSSFYIFLARNLINSSSIYIKKTYYKQMIEFLFSSEHKRFEERQQILIQLFKDENQNPKIEISDFLNKSETNKMYKICEMIHRDNHDWIKLLQVYIQENENEIFDYIHSMLSLDQYLQTELEKDKFLNVVFDNFLVLIKLDSTRAVNLFFTYFDQSDNLFELICEKLSDEPIVLYEFLKLTILENRINYTKSSNNPNEPLGKIYELCLNSSNQEKFISLACQIEPSDVVDILETLQEYSDTAALKICNKHENKDGKAFLYEKTKQYNKSFKIFFEDFKIHVDQLIENSISSAFTNNSASYNFELILNKFNKLLEFCKRTFNYSIDDKIKEQFWLSSLEFLIEIKIDLNNIRNLNNEKYLAHYLNLFSDSQMKKDLDDLVGNMEKHFKFLFEKLINTMLNHFNLGIFLDIIISKVLNQNEDMYDIREMLLCILENYNYEKTLLELTNNILSSEHNHLMNRYRVLNTKPKIVRQLYCSLCGRSDRGMKGNKDRFVIYHCNHLYHHVCIDTVSKYKNSNQISCPLCTGLISEKESQTIKKKLLIINELKEEEAGYDESQLNSNLLHLNESQFRALNYFHSGRLKRSVK